MSDNNDITSQEELVEQQQTTQTNDSEKQHDHRTKPPERREEHTKKNTTVKQQVNAAWRTLPNQEDAIGSIPIFLGTMKEQFQEKVQMLKLWMEATSAEQLLKDGRIADSVAKPRIQMYQEYRQEKYPDMSDEDFDKMFRDFLTFNQDSVELALYRNSRNYNEHWTNQTLFANDFVETDVVGRLPLQSKTGLSMAAQMIRGSARTSKEPISYDVLVRDSFTQLRLDRSDLLEIGDLIDQINRQVVGYTRRINGNSLTLARVAMYRVFWDHIIGKIQSHSVKGLTDFRELGGIINFNTLNEIFVEFICEVGRSGIPFTLYCTEPGCHWNDTQTIEPELLKYFDPTMLTNNQAAAIGNIRNGVKTYSKEEIAKLKAESKWVETDRIYFDDRKQYLVISPATVNEAFSSFDVFMEFMEPRIDELRTRYVSDEKYEEQLSQLMDTYRSMEFIHWVAELHIIEEDGEEIVYTRKENPMEFMKGIIDILNQSKNLELGTDLIQFVQKHGAEFTSTIIGVPNYACPKCGESSGEHAGVKGVTPVDAFTCFFILSRLEMGRRQVRMAAADAVL